MSNAPKCLPHCLHRVLYLLPFSEEKVPRSRFSPFFLLLAGVVALTLFHPTVALASGESTAAEPHDITLTLLWIAVILIIAKVSSLVERFGQPSVLGELVIGVVLGNLTLVGIHLFEPIRTDSIIAFLAELGVIILLFQIGLESNIDRMKKVGMRAFLVACIGVIAPFVFGAYVAGPWLLPGLSANAYLFIGAALTATSVGITARVFQDMKKLHIPEAQIVLGAAVIDDVLGLIILAIISAIVTTGGVSLGIITWITAKAILFLVGSIVVGQLFAPKVGKLLAKIHSGTGMKFTLAICFCLGYAYLAKQVGLAPIVGAFAAGLLLDPVHFNYFEDSKIVSDLKQTVDQLDTGAKEKIMAVIAPHSHRHVEDLIAPIGLFLIPIFFVVTGMNVELSAMFDFQILLVSLGLTALAFISKIVSGLAAGKVNKYLVGFGMVPRGEVGLIFATMGRGLNVISTQVFSIIVVMIILTTLLTPPILATLIRRHKGA